MKRSTTDVLRRGLDSTLANWPLIAIRIVEGLLFLTIIIGSIIAAVIPMIVAAGLSNFDVHKIGDSGPAVAAAILEHWVIILYILGLMTIVLLLLVGIHSFVEAGSAQVLVDAERNANGVAAPRREAFNAFNMDRWMRGGRSSWWSVFWIYNVAWGVGGLIILVPLLITMAAMLAVSDLTGRVVIGCAGMALAFVVAMPMAIAIAIWTQKAITICVARTASANAALQLARQAIRVDLGRHVAVAFVVFVVSVGGAMVLSMISAPASFMHHQDPFSGLVFAPLQIVVSLAQSIFSAAVGTWFLASYVGLTEER